MVGRKLLAVLAAMSVLIFGVVCAFEAFSRSSAKEQSLCSDKLYGGAQVELATTEMQGAQRGLMLSCAMKDAEGVSTQNRKFLKRAR
jgi:hypothetical protein